MKKLLALFILLGVVGCVSTPESTGILDSRNAPLGCNSWGVCRHSSHQNVTGYDNVELQANYDLVAYPKAEAINLKTGEKYHFGHSVSYDACNTWSDDYDLHCPKIHIERLCEEALGSECVLSRVNDLTYYASHEDLIVKVRLKKERAEALFKEQQENQTDKAEKRLAVIHALKERCISYGFTGNNNIAACVQREAKHDYEIEQKDYELELARQQIIAQQSQQPVLTEVPWYLSILEGVAEGIAEGYKQQALIQTMDSRYEKKDIYRYCRPNC